MAFYEGESEKDSDVEQKVFYNAITKGTELIVKPEQAVAEPSFL
ncbi:MAG: hypothetical protein WCD89_23145 [Anaerocolumna sp.]